MQRRIRRVLRLLRGRWIALTSIVASATVVAVLSDWDRAATVGLVALLWLLSVAAVRTWRQQQALARQIHSMSQQLDVVQKRIEKSARRAPWEDVRASARRTLGVVERWRVETADDLVRLHDAVYEVSQSVSETAGQMETRHSEIVSSLEAELLVVMRRHSNEIHHRLEYATAESAALANLYALLDVDREMPSLGGCAADAQTLTRLVRLALEVSDQGLIVESGSGTSTVWLALACQRSGRGRVIALEHDEKNAALTRKALEVAGLADLAEVRIAPLEAVTIEGEPYQWYARSTWANLTAIELLFVHSGAGFLRPIARYPALSLLAPALAPAAVTVVDDAGRTDEREAIQRWSTIRANKWKRPLDLRSGPKSPTRVFVLTTGRSGSTTFARACGHISNLTSGHESRARLDPDERFDYPDGHIEVDNRLSWLTGQLAERFPEAWYVHLIRDPRAVADSVLARWPTDLQPRRAGILGAFSHGILMRSAPWPDASRPEVASLLVESIEANLRTFLADRRHMVVRLERAQEDFPAFWSWIRAEGDLAAGCAEFEVRHNASGPSQF